MDASDGRKSWSLRLSDGSPLSLTWLQKLILVPLALTFAVSFLMVVGFFMADKAPTSVLMVGGLLFIVSAWGLLTIGHRAGAPEQGWEVAIPALLAFAILAIAVWTQVYPLGVLGLLPLYLLAGTRSPRR